MESLFEIITSWHDGSLDWVYIRARDEDDAVDKFKEKYPNRPIYHVIFFLPPDILAPRA